MKQKIDLNVDTRQPGRGVARQLRLKKMIPGIIYGASENIGVSIHENDIIKYNSRAFENALLTIQSKDSKLNGKVALLKEVIIHPVTRRPEHVDLFALDLTKNVRVSVEIRITGKAIGLAEGGLLNVVIRQVEVECLPTAIPESIEVDVTNLNVGDSIHVSDLTVPNGIKMISRPELTIAAVVVQEEEVVATPAAAAAPAAGAAAAPAAAGGAAKAAEPAKK